MQNEGDLDKDVEIYLGLVDDLQLPFLEIMKSARDAVQKIIKAKHPKVCSCKGCCNEVVWLLSMSLVMEYQIDQPPTPPARIAAQVIQSYMHDKARKQGVVKETPISELLRTVLETLKGAQDEQSTNSNQQTPAKETIH